jgi:hypothetical protein
VIVALLSIPEPIYKFLQSVSCEHTLTQLLGEQGYQLAGVIFFALMGFTLYRVATAKPEEPPAENKPEAAAA